MEIIRTRNERTYRIPKELKSVERILKIGVAADERSTEIISSLLQERAGMRIFDFQNQQSATPDDRMNELYRTILSSHKTDPMLGAVINNFSNPRAIEILNETGKSLIIYSDKQEVPEE